MTEKTLALIRGALVESEATAASRLVLVILATFADGKHLARPAVATIAAMAKVTDRCVQLALRELVNFGEITIATKGGGRNRPTVYEIKVKPCSPFELTERVKSKKGVLRSDPGPNAYGETVNSSSPEGVYGEKAGNLSRLKSGHALRDVSFFSYSEDEREVIDLYHARLVNLRKGWLRVTKFTDTVRDVIAKLTLDEWREVLDSFPNEPKDWPPGNKTLVRLYYHIFP